jgi:hypothetical protein
MTVESVVPDAVGLSATHPKEQSQNYSFGRFAEDARALCFTQVDRTHERRGCGQILIGWRQR